MDERLPILKGGKPRSRPKDGERMCVCVLRERQREHMAYAEPNYAGDWSLHHNCHKLSSSEKTPDTPNGM